MINISEKNGAVIFTARIIPRASRSEIVGSSDDALKVRISSPPVDGAANAELVKLLAKTLGVAKSNVEITSGQTSRIKQIRVIGITTEQFKTVLGI